MSLISVTRSPDGEKVYINPSQVRAVYPHYVKNETVIHFSGNDEDDLIVLEDCDTVVYMMEMYG
jgi:hypothetical protein